MNNLDNFLPIIHTSDVTNHTFSSESFKWNETHSESLALFHHPILYGVAIYALFLIIIGTIGKSILNFEIKMTYFQSRKSVNYHHSSSSKFTKIYNNALFNSSCYR